MIEQLDEATDYADGSGTSLHDVIDKLNEVIRQLNRLTAWADKLDPQPPAPKPVKEKTSDE